MQYTRTQAELIAMLQAAPDRTLPEFELICGRYVAASRSKAMKELVAAGVVIRTQIGGTYPLYIRNITYTLA